MENETDSLKCPACKCILEWGTLKKLNKKINKLKNLQMTVVPFTKLFEKLGGQIKELQDRLYRSLKGAIQDQDVTLCLNCGEILIYKIDKINIILEKISDEYLERIKIGDNATYKNIINVQKLIKE